MPSRYFGSHRPLKSHLLRGSGGIASEVGSLWTAVEGAFLTLQTEQSGVTAARPTSPFVGQTYYNVTIPRFEMWDGTAWEAVGGAGGVSSPTGGNVWSANSSQASSAYASGLRYVPLTNGASDFIEFQFIAASTATVTLDVLYAMSAADAGAVVLRLDTLKLAVGDNPTTAATSGAPATVTPGNDVLMHSSGATFTLAVTAGQTVYCKLLRLGADAADTHTGNMHVVEMRVNQ